MDQTSRSHDKIAHLVLRIGTAFALIYSAISGFITPDNWIGYFPSFTQEILSVNTILIFWGIIEIILAVWILSGWKIKTPSIIGAVAMLGLIVFNFNQMDILFRDVTIMSVFIALAIWKKKE